MTVGCTSTHIYTYIQYIYNLWNKYDISSFDFLIQIEILILVEQTILTLAKYIVVLMLMIIEFFAHENAHIKNKMTGSFFVLPWIKTTCFSFSLLRSYTKTFTLLFSSIVSFNQNITNLIYRIHNINAWKITWENIYAFRSFFLRARTKNIKEKNAWNRVSNVCICVTETVRCRMLTGAKTTTKYGSMCRWCDWRWHCMYIVCIRFCVNVYDCM